MHIKYSLLYLYRTIKQTKMKKIIDDYQKRISNIDSQIKNRVSIIRETRNNPERVFDNEAARIDKKVLDAKRQLLVQVIKDLEDCELLIACTELDKGDAFAHINDVPTMISKAGNILELHANNNGNTSVIAKSLQNIANNINNAIN